MNDLATNDLFQLIEARQTIKAKLEAMDKEHEEATKEWKAGLMQVEGKIVTELDSRGIENFRAGNNTAYFEHIENMRVLDRQDFFEWVIANDATDVLTSHVSKDAIRARGEIPPGIEVSRIRKLRIRKV
jgi:hypothetical protein